MELTRAQKIRLGTFMVSGTVLFAGGIVTLTGLRMWRDRDIYTVQFQENVSGLEPGAPVKFQGLRVGRVDRMRVALDDPGAIEITLSLVPGTTLHNGAKAILDTSGLTGLKTINITPGDPRTGTIEPGSRLDAGESLVDRLTGQAEQIGIKIELVANQLAKWTQKENRQRVERLLDSLTALSGQMESFLATNRKPMERALNEVANASKAFTGVAGEGEHSIELVRHEIDRTLEEARTTIKEYRRPLEKVDSQQVADTISAAHRAMVSLDSRLSDARLSTAVDGLLTALAELTQLLKNTDLVVRSGRADFTATLKYVRQAAEDLREFSRIIAQNPSALISGRE